MGEMSEAEFSEFCGWSELGPSGGGGHTCSGERRLAGMEKLVVWSDQRKGVNSNFEMRKSSKVELTHRVVASSADFSRRRRSDLAVRFSHAADFFKAMAQARVDNSLHRAFRSVITPDLLILDDLGLHRLTAQQSADLYDLILN